VLYRKTIISYTHVHFFPDAVMSGDQSLLLCPECGLLLTGKVAALDACGHVLHAACADYIARMGRTRGARCPHCKLAASSSRALHAAVSSTASQSAPLSGEVIASLEAAVRLVHARQATIIGTDRKVRHAKSDLLKVQRECAEIHHVTAQLRSRVAASFGNATGAATGKDSCTTSSSPAPPPNIFRHVGSSEAFALDPLTSVAKLQQYIRSVVQAEAEARSQLQAAAAEETSLGEDIAKLRHSIADLERRGYRIAPRDSAAGGRENTVALARRVGMKAARPAEGGEGTVVKPEALDRTVYRVCAGAVPQARVDLRSTNAVGPNPPPLSPSAPAFAIVLPSDSDADSDVEVLVERVPTAPFTRLLPPSSVPAKPNAVTSVGAQFRNVGARFGEIPRPRPQQRTLALTSAGSLQSLSNASLEIT
jgi:hypothetical protein